MNTVKIDYVRFKEIAKQKGYTQTMLASETGINISAIKLYMSGAKEPKVPEVKLICRILECDESELQEKKKTIRTTSVSEAMGYEALNKSIEKLTNEMISIQNDLGKLATIILDVQKETHETRAQLELNRDEVQATFSKATEINSTVNRISGAIKGIRTKY